MRYTNVLDLPKAFETFERTRKYDKGKADFSVTELFGPPRQRLLVRKHYDEISVDSSEEIFKVFGSAVHHVLEHGAGFDERQEERLFMPIAGRMVSGQVDSIKERKRGSVLIRDYKVTSVWSVMLDEKADWLFQLNAYAALVRHNWREKYGYTPRVRCEIIAILRDWSKREARTTSGYPKTPVVVVPIRNIGSRRIIKEMAERVKLHLQAEADLAAGRDLPLCTPDEMWQKPTVWAVKKPKNKRAIKLFPTEEEAIKFQRIYSVAAKPVKTEVEKRLGERTRCQDYCYAAPFCTQKKSQELIDKMHSQYEETPL